MIEWILDSGCTDHVINNENYFNNSIKLKEPIKVRVGDGSFESNKNRTRN